MLRIVENLIGAIVMSFTNILIWKNLSAKKINFSDILTIIIIIVMPILILLNYFFVNQFIKILTIVILMSLCIKFLFNEKINISIVTAVVSEVIYLISEMIFALLLLFILKIDPNEFNEIFFGTVFTNIIVSSIVIIISYLKPTKKLYNYFIKITDKIKAVYLVIVLLILMIVMNVFIARQYYKLDFIYVIIFNCILIIFCFTIVADSLNNKNKYAKIYSKYNTTLTSLKEYEEILKNYRILNHENKNNLLTIRNMINKKEKDAINYIDSILKDKLVDNDKISNKVQKIPPGGLRGLIYSKLLYMDDKKINYKLDISKEIYPTKIIKNIDDSLMLDICKIIGVYLDNAIDAVEHIKNKNIIISMWLDGEDMIISISNTYIGNIDIERIEEQGYSTKGKDHGYGLTLTKSIIANNKKLFNQKKLDSNNFTQILKIKIRSI